MMLYLLSQKKEQEKKEQEAQRASEELVDTAPVLSTSQAPPTKPEETGEGLDEQVSISVEELKELNQVVQSLKVDQDRTQLEELKEDREEYIEVSPPPQPWACTYSLALWTGCV